MDILVNVAKVAGILIALVGLRFLVIRHSGQNSKVNGALKTVLRFLLPPLITAAPMFIAISAAVYPMKTPSLPPFFVYAAFGGGVGLSIGLAAMFIMVVKQGEKVDRLEQLIATEGHQTPE